MARPRLARAEHIHSFRLSLCEPSIFTSKHQTPSHGRGSVHTMSPQYQPPGRLGNPDLSLATDPRVNLKLATFLNGMGMDQNIPPTRVSPASGMELVQKMISKADRMSEQMDEMLRCDLPGDDSRPKVTRKDITIKGVDDNDIKLHVFRRADSVNQKLPCVVYIQYVPLL